MLRLKGVDVDVNTVPRRSRRYRRQRNTQQERTVSPEQRPIILEERSPTPTLISNVNEERAPSPSLFLQEAEERVRNPIIAESIAPVYDEGDELSLDFLNERSILKKNVLIREYMLSGGKSVKILIDHLASFLKIIQKAIESIPQLEPNDRIQVNIKPKSWDHHISTPIVRVRDFRPSFLLAAIQAAAQSGMNLRLDDDIRLDIRYLKVGNINSIRGGRKQYRHISSRLSIKCRRCIVEILNEDCLCLPRALAVGIAKHNVNVCEPNKKVYYTKIFDKIKRKPANASFSSNIQTVTALSYCRKAGVSPDVPIGMNEIRSFEDCLDVIIKIIDPEQFIAITYDTMKRYENLLDIDKPIIYLYRTYSVSNSLYHYDCIINITGFYNSKHFCNYCNVPYKSRHVCCDISVMYVAVISKTMWLFAIPVTRYSETVNVRNVIKSYHAAKNVITVSYVSSC